MEVIVQDANNIVIEVDQGRQGRGVEDVSLITVGADYYLLFTFTDGTTEQVGPIATTVTEVISAEVRNAEAVTILKGQPVYLYQAQGNLATVKLAYNTSDATSAKTLGLAAENIAPNAQGLITCQGTLGGLNTSAYNEGDTLYLGATAGTLTSVKPQAPNHLVYVGVVERANAGAGQIYVRVQNGFELDEIHDVRIVSPVNGNTLIYDASTSLWKNAGITAGSGISVTNGAASITVGNTGVLSFSGGTTGLTPATATTGAVSLAGTLAIANGGTGQTTANAALNALLPAQTSQSGKYLKTDGSNAAWDQLDISTADITGTLPIANGGTGQSTANAGLNALLPSQTSQSGKYLKTDGTNASWDQLDISTADITGTLPVANGGTGVTTSTGTGSVVLSNSPALTTPNLGTPSAVTLTNATGLPLSTGVTGTLATTNGGTGLTSFTSGGVVYASSSSALATGSGLTYNGTSTLFLITSGGTPFISINRGGGEYLNIGVDSTGVFYNTAVTNVYRWLLNGGDEQMRLTSTGLGIGTSSPSYRLDARGASGIGVQFLETSSGNSTRVQLGTASGVGYIDANAGVGSIALGFNVAGTERMRLDSSGNLGLGVTPSAWGGGYKGLQVTAGASLGSNGANAMALGQNWFYNGTNDIYLGNFAASVYQQLNGSHRWYIAPSGTAGNTISFTQAMTLDASGNLGVGTTSPSNRIHAFNTTTTQLQVQMSGQADMRVIADTGYGALSLESNMPLIFRTNATERARITSTGNVVAGGSVALATTATDGFLYVPTCAGTPTGTPTAITGMAPIVVDTTNNKMYFYSGGAWRDAGP